jgi:hypothetical protein
MAKRRPTKPRGQVPCLCDQRLADRTVVWHWKPSPRLRRAGFVNVKLGTDERVAINAALDLNEQVRQWEVAAPVAADPAPAPRLPRVVRMAELIRRYRESADFTDLKPKTRAEYDVRLRQLATWALDGALPVRDITVDLVGRLREGLLQGSRHKAAAILRVLRLLLAYAERAAIIPKGSNPAAGARIPEPPARKVRLAGAVRVAIGEAADALGLPDVAFAIDLGLWMVQREGDLLALNRMAWREMSDPDVDPRHLATLANGQGQVLGFRLQQQKTGVWIDAPLPAFLHDAVTARLAGAPGWLFRHPDDPAQPLPDWLFQRRFAEARGSAAAVAIMDGDDDLAAAIAACQFRDLRRTGMIAYKDAGAKLPWITALSGHAVLGKKTILDTYMPGDTAGAIACVATGVRARQAQQRRASGSAG